MCTSGSYVASGSYAAAGSYYAAGSYVASGSYVAAIGDPDDPSLSPNRQIERETRSIWYMKLVHNVLTISGGSLQEGSAPFVTSRTNGYGACDVLVQ